jgi:hypothetical protein
MFFNPFLVLFSPEKKSIQSSPHSRNKNYGEDYVSRAVGRELNYLFFRTSPVSAHSVLADFSLSHGED